MKEEERENLSPRRTQKERRPATVKELLKERRGNRQDDDDDMEDFIPQTPFLAKSNEVC